jgi:hypothetical protein
MSGIIGVNPDMRSGVVGKFPPDQIIQIVSISNASGTTTSTGNYDTTSITATITPTSAINKVLILASPQVMCHNSGGADAQVGIKIYSNGAAGGAGSGTFAAISTEQKIRGYDYGLTGINVNIVPAINWLDSPSLAVAIIYTIYIKNIAGTDSRVNSGGNSTIFLMEVAG